METTKEFRTAASSTEAINLAYQALRKAAPKKGVVSMNYVRMKAGIPSRGYFSLVMNGKRLLSRKYGEPLARVLKLKDFEYELFIALLDLDHESNAKQRHELKHRIARYRKILNRGDASLLPCQVDQEALAVRDVYCAFSLFSEGAREEEITSLFGEAREPSVRLALKNLCKMGFLRKESDRYVVARDEFFHESKEKLIFSSKVSKDATAHYIRSSFAEAAGLVDSFRQHADDAFITSVTVSVNKAEYRNILNDFKRRILELAASLSDTDSDQVIRINVGVYPVAPCLGAPMSRNEKGAQPSMPAFDS